ncbi:hypothetical protein PIB30_028984 [Stylosanthes scabra]|uniref:Uncharacterized protein n=1 Tax=Stylosanthes scabra TaxID=79078 RepID=A0ABU6VA28_9FABA|nr:hypothetical protein [Stylosanthes scabra]
MAHPRPPYLMGKFPLVARLRDLDNAPAPPCFVTSKARTTRACAAATKLTKMKAILGISLFRAMAHRFLKPNSTYMGEEQLKRNNHSLISSILALERQAFTSESESLMRCMEDLSMFQRPRFVALEYEKSRTYGTVLIYPLYRLVECGSTGYVTTI